MINRPVLAALVVLACAAGVTTGSALRARHGAEQESLASAASRTTVVPDRDQDPPPLAPPSPPPNPLILTPPPPPPPPPPHPVKGTPCMSNISACVKLSTRQAWLISGGKVVVGPVSITSGKSGERTPIGLHHVIWKDADHKSREFDDAPMPWSVFFAAGGIAFHTGSLRAQSSGCIHLADSVARRFYRTLGVGDAVLVLR
jgi:L,D-transpeptidase catalytic domain